MSALPKERSIILHNIESAKKQIVDLKHYITKCERAIQEIDDAITFPTPPADFMAPNPEEYEPEENEPENCLGGEQT